MQPIHTQAEQVVETRQKLVDSSLLTNESWDEFRRRFERVHPGFFAQLKAQFADLSPAEERLLALSKLDIDTRQMSRMLGIAPDSIRKTKYRLRKKLGLHGTSPLVTLPAEPMGYPAND
jgi:DNA-binding CsgD family transcriptional regulator